MGKLNVSVRFSCDPLKVHKLIYTGRANIEIFYLFNFIPFLSLCLMNGLVQHVSLSVQAWEKVIAVFRTSNPKVMLK